MSHPRYENIIALKFAVVLVYTENAVDLLTQYELILAHK